MDIKAYIASGILENYILGLVSDQERQEVEQYARQYPEIKSEISAIELALEQYTLAQARPMPKGLDQQILAHLQQLDLGQNLSTTKPPVAKTSSKNVSSSNQWLTGLLGVLSLLSIGAAWFFNQQASDLKATVTTKDEQLLNQQIICDGQAQRLQQQLDILRDNTYRSILMKGTDKAPDALAAVYYNESTQKSFLDVRNLPAPTADKQYQLWAIVEGTPVDMGVFDLPIDIIDFIEIPHVAGAQAFAVTLEQKGGQATPTLEEMYVIGNT